MKLKKNTPKIEDIKRNTLLPCEYEFTCVSCGFNVIKRKNDLSKIQLKKINFINRLNYAEVKLFSICMDVYKINEGDDLMNFIKFHQH